MHLIAFQYACFLTQLVLCVIRGRVSATEREALRPALTSSGIESFEVKCWDKLSKWEKKNSRNKKKNETYKTSSASFGFVADTKKIDTSDTLSKTHTHEAQGRHLQEAQVREIKNLQNQKAKRNRWKDVKRWSLNFDSTIEKTKLKR